MIKYYRIINHKTIIKMYPRKTFKLKNKPKKDNP